MSFTVNHSSLEEENRILKSELQAKSSELLKLKALSEQKNAFLTQQLEEVKAREANIKSMNESIMAVLQDITNSNTKISTELQLKQLFEEHFLSISMNRSSFQIEEELKKTRAEFDKFKAIYDERYNDLLKEKEILNFRVKCLEEEKTRILIEYQSLKLSSQGAVEKLKYEYEREISRLKNENEGVQGFNSERSRMDLMKSQIKEIATQHLIETNSLKNALAESKTRLERLHDAFCEMKEKNLHLKTIIKSFRAKENKLKEILFEKLQDIEEDDEEIELAFTNNFDGSFHNFQGKPNIVPRALEYSSITNAYDAFASQDYLRIFNDNQIISPLNSERVDLEKLANPQELLKKRSYSSQIQIESKIDEFSKPFELQQREKIHIINDSPFKNEESLDEFKIKGDLNNTSSFMNNYNEFNNRNKKTMKSLN